MISILDEYTAKLSMDVFPNPKIYNGKIYHYTSINNINPILLSNNRVVLWAIRYDCLNDISEGTLPEIRFAEVCEEIKNEDVISSQFYALIKDIKPTRTGLIMPIVNNKLRPVRDEYDAYITSFSKNDDLLPMWNYYSKGSAFEGVNIGTHAQLLVDGLQLPGKEEGKITIRIFEVIYDEKTQKDIIKKFITELYKNYDKKYDTSVRYFISNNLALLKLMFKSSYFEHEQEVRMIVQIYKKFKSDIPVKYRTQAGLIIPYIELLFDKDVIRYFTLGPIIGDDNVKKKQLDIIHEILNNHGYTINEKYSNAPIRY